MSPASTFVQVKDKCTSLVEIKLIIQKRNMDFPYDYVLLKIKILYNIGVCFISLTSYEVISTFRFFAVFE